MSVKSALSPEQARVLKVFEALRIRAGFGLTLGTLAHELGGGSEEEVRKALDGMVQKGFLQVMAEVPDYYLLTQDGERLFNPLA